MKAPSCVITLSVIKELPCTSDSYTVHITLLVYRVFHLVTPRVNARRDNTLSCLVSYAETKSDETRDGTTRDKTSRPASAYLVETY